MTKDEPGKNRSPAPLLDAESFWDETSDEEETTQPHVPSPQVERAQTPVRPAAPPPPVFEDDDLAVVGPAGFDQGQPPQNKRPPPPTRGRKPPSAQPRPPTPHAVQQAALPVRPAAQPRVQARPQPPPARPSPPRRPPPPPPFEQDLPRAQDVELDDGLSLSKIGLSALLVAAVAGFLGWFLIGRHNADVQVEPAKDELNTPAQRPDAGLSGARQASIAGQAQQQGRTAAKASSTKASIAVSSDPPGALVFLNKEHRGVTPANVRGLEPNTDVELRIELKGYKPWILVIGLDEEDLEREVHAGLTKLEGCKNGTGFLYVITKPPGATIEINGKRLPGRTPKVVNDVCAATPLALRLEKVGFRPWRKEIRIAAGDIHNLEAKLEK